MTVITYVGAGAAASGDYAASLTPALPAGAIAGDVLLCLAVCRKTSVVVGTPAGWKPLLADGHVLLCGKIMAPGESAPTVTYSGGVAGDSVIAQVAAFRGATLGTNMGPVVISNASAQNINLPAPSTPGRPGSVLLFMGWKQNNWTSVGNIADAEIGEPSTALGLTTGMVWDYDIQTTPTASPAGFYTVTGGVAAISKAYLLALNAAFTIAVNTQDVYPPRNQVVVNGIQIGDAVTVYRVVDGVRTPVRAGNTPAATDVAFLCVDAELPFGVPVSYVAVVNNDEASTSPVTYTLPGGKVALSDAISGLAAEVVIWAWPEKDYARPATVFKPGGRNVVVSGDFAQYESDVELYTDTTSSAENLRTLLAAATQGIVQIRQPGGYDDVDGYAAVTNYQSRRYAQDGSDDKRIHQLHLVQVDGWATSLAASGFTYQDLINAYAGLTYANLAADFATYLDLNQGDFS